jgi:hypothetical protein
MKKIKVFEDYYNYNDYVLDYKVDKSHITKQIEDNKRILLDEMMGKIGITEEDLKKDISWIKAKIRDSKISDIID